MAGTPKPLTAAQLAVAALGVIKTASVVFVMMMLEWTRKQKAMAEKGQAVAESSLAIEKSNTGIKDATAAKDPGTVIDDFLHDKGPGG